MKRTVAIGLQDFEKLRSGNWFYIDKTDFIRRWWNQGDDVTLITRPRRFGKTLNMSMLNCFFSNKYENRSDLFEGLDVWEDEAIRKEQGSWPVVFLSFAGIKGTTWQSTMYQMKALISELFGRYPELKQSDRLDEEERKKLSAISQDMPDEMAALSIHLLSVLLEKVYGKKVLIFLDEYDTPLQEVYIGGFWDELMAFTRTMFNNTFKTNPSLARAVMTGITRVSKESIFSDLNNLVVVTTTSSQYADCFGFTEEEVFTAMKEQGYGEKEQADVKLWYDGFTFGGITDIYNPWSVINYLNTGKLDTYWANTSGNGLVGTLLRRGSPEVKQQFETLLQGDFIEASFDEQIIFSQLDHDKDAIWSLLLASGYLKILLTPAMQEPYFRIRPVYRMALTNGEVRIMFDDMIRRWFNQEEGLTPFVRSMLRGDVLDMEEYLNRIALRTFSSFDAGNHPGGAEPERFYHGFVLGLLVDQVNRYQIRSNRESGFGRYDVMMIPEKENLPGVILEFKVFNSRRGEASLEDTASNALKQIEEKQYETELTARGIPSENILKYGLAFQGKECRILKGK